MIKTAILIDGAFYRKRSSRFLGGLSPHQAADFLYKYCMKHLLSKPKEDPHSLYRIFYYDCPPSNKQVYHPLSDKTIDLKKQALYQWSSDFLEKLKSKRKLALRLGNLADEQAFYNLKHEVTKKLLKKTLTLNEITANDFTLSIKQKGVDMRIGIDIATISMKKLVDKIILIAGDSDFVPAAKLARREGIDFVLDAMGAAIKPELHEHIDGLKTINFGSLK